MYLEKGLLLPEMQRRYVWTSTQVRDLMDTVYHDYPSGSILLWKTDQLPETRTSAVQGEKEDTVRDKLLLLDGQQRITALATIMTGHPIRGKDGALTHIDLYFNVDHPEKCCTDESEIESEEYQSQFFQVKNRAIENQPTWISVTKLFTKGVGEILKDLRVNYDDPRFELINQRLNHLYNTQKNYVYPVQILPKELSYAEATRVFVRVNSMGTRLSKSDLALAQVTSRWSGSMKLFEDFVDKCSKSSFFIDEGFLMRCMMAIATGQCKFERTARTPIEDIQDAWEKTKEGFEFVVNFTKQNAKISSSNIIPSSYLFIPLLAYAVRNEMRFGKEERSFIRWFYAASMWGRYSGASETALDQDLNAMLEEKPAEALLKNLLHQVGRLEVKEDDLLGKGISSPFFMMTYVLAVNNEAKDWGTGLALNLTNIGEEHKIEHDHIFPRSKLTTFLKQKYEDEETIKKLVNDMANIAFLSRRENPSKSSRQPNEYLRAIKQRIGVDALTAQSIPLEEELWNMDRYEDFLAARRKLIVAGINRIMEQLLTEPSTTQTIITLFSESKKEEMRHIQLENRVHELSDEIQTLLGACNNICSSKSKEVPFKLTSTMMQEIANIGKVATTQPTLEDLLSSLFKIIYEGSGNLVRIPDSLKTEDFIGFTIKHLRNSMQHDLEHGHDEKEIIAKKIRVARIYEKYVGKTTIDIFEPQDFPKLQVKLLEELKVFLDSMKQYCSSL